MAGFIPPDKLEQIRSANDIVDIIGAVLPLKRAGANFTALCPFHKEKSPSFNVNPHKQIFHCFGCHKGGDVFTFVREYENLSFIEAVKRLADRANIPIEFDNQPGQQQARHLKDTLLQMHEGIAQRWETALANDAAAQIARDYLVKRGVSGEAVRLFRLGYAPEAWDDTVNWAKHKGYELPLVEQGGLIIRKEETDRYYDRFRGRLMFPICDEQGRVIGFSGRVLSGDEKTAKYVNSPETPIFTKGKVFFGLDKSKRAILDAGYAIICEGQLDLIACYMAGVKNIVAPQGTAFTLEHARILKRYVEEVVLCFDSDPAGQNAAVRVFDTLLATGLSARVVTLPTPHDPDSFVKEHGGAAFGELSQKAQAFPEFFLHLLCRTNDLATDTGRMSVMKGMGELLRKIGTPVIVPSYARKVAERLSVSSEVVRKEFEKHISIGFGGGQSGMLEINKWSRGDRIANDPLEEPGDKPIPTAPPPSEREFWLLRFLLIDDHLDWVAQYLDLNWIQHPIINRAVSLRLEAHRQQTWRGVPALIDQLEDSAAASLITEAVNEGQSASELSRNLSETVRMLRNDFIDRQLTDLKHRLARPELPEGEMMAILVQQSELRRLKQQPMA
jgi:DNA primase